MNKVISMEYVTKNYISKKTLKEKLEQYKQQKLKMEQDDVGVGFTLGKEWNNLKTKIEVLQELLEEKQ